MERIDSSFTFFAKYFYPLIYLIIPFIFFGVFLYKELWIPLIFCFMAIVALSSICYNFFWQLKNVYLDEKNKKVIINRTEILFNQIKRVESIVILRNSFIIVKLKNEIKGKHDFVFKPRNEIFYDKTIEVRLNKLIQN